jgi:hypothetical protein
MGGRHSNADENCYTYLTLFRPVFRMVKLHTVAKGNPKDLNLFPSSPCSMCSVILLGFNDSHLGLADTYLSTILTQAVGSSFELHPGLLQPLGEVLLNKFLKKQYIFTVLED